MQVKHLFMSTSSLLERNPVFRPLAKCQLKGSYCGPQARTLQNHWEPRVPSVGPLGAGPVTFGCPQVPPDVQHESAVKTLTRLILFYIFYFKSKSVF